MKHKKNGKIGVCIYCKQAKVLTDEHFPNQAFGSFEKRPPLKICGDCNKIFGNTIDLYLGRDSLEGLFRIRYGIVRPDDDHRFVGRRVRITLPGPGEWEGVILELYQSGDSVAVRPIPQAAFREHSGQWRHMTLKELRDDTIPLPPTNRSEGTKIFAASDSGVDAVLEALASRGCPIELVKRIPRFDLVDDDGTLLARVEARIDESIARCIAKFAFNYMAATEGSRFALSSDFDRIRSFIGRAEGDWRRFVSIDSRPILWDETVRWQKTDGHIVTLACRRGGTAYCADVSLFNVHHYRVTMAFPFTGLVRPPRGSLFDFRSRSIVEMQPTTLILPSYAACDVARWR